MTSYNRGAFHSGKTGRKDAVGYVRYCCVTDLWQKGWTDRGRHSGIAAGCPQVITSRSMTEEEEMVLLLPQTGDDLPSFEQAEMEDASAEDTTKDTFLSENLAVSITDMDIGEKRSIDGRKQFEERYYSWMSGWRRGRRRSGICGGI